MIACNYKLFNTSTIVKINDDMTFNTLNSVYKIELIEETNEKNG